MSRGSLTFPASVFLFLFHHYDTFFFSSYLWLVGHFVPALTSVISAAFFFYFFFFFSNSLFVCVCFSTSRCFVRVGSIDQQFAFSVCSLIGFLDHVVAGLAGEWLVILEVVWLSSHSLLLCISLWL